jgi:hypothetical protein
VIPSVPFLPATTKDLKGTWLTAAPHSEVLDQGSDDPRSEKICDLAAPFLQCRSDAGALTLPNWHFCTPSGSARGQIGRDDCKNVQKEIDAILSSAVSCGVDPNLEHALLYASPTCRTARRAQFGVHKVKLLVGRMRHETSATG